MYHMLYIYTGTDRMKARAAMNTAIAAYAKNIEVIHITDVHTMEDFEAVLGGGGMFFGARVVVLEGIFACEEMRERALNQVAALTASADHFFFFEEKIDAATRRQLEKYATKCENFDMPKKADKSSSIFALGNALRARNKKNLWVSYQRELLAESAPEAIHGVLFWAAKQQLLSARSDGERIHSKKLVGILTKLPHEARRQGVELGYALEQFVLSDDVVS